MAQNSKTIKLETDYLIIGGGAMGMAFVDEMVNRSFNCGNNQNTEFIIIDKHAKPGGHWNDAYQFVSLHQPAAYYGVNSKELGEGGNDLVSKAQILAYYELVLKDFLATGRVKFYSLCEYVGDNKFKSLVENGLEYEVSVRKKTVDSTYMDVRVPSITKPKFEVAPELTLLPINGLSDVRSPWEKYVVLGAGKTGIDAVLFLISQNVNPDKILWIMPNDAWFMVRDGLHVDVLEASTFGILDVLVRDDVKSVKDIFLHYEKIGYFSRINEEVWPTAFKCATVSTDELHLLRKVKNIVRRGRIESLEHDKIIFKDKSEMPASKDYLYIDCTSNGLGKRPSVPIFNGKKICLQAISQCQQVYSAAALGAVEARFSDNDELMNKISIPVPHPEYPEDYIKTLMTTMQNQDLFAKEGPGFSWLRSSRLNALYHFSFTGLIKFAFWDYRYNKVLNDKLEMLK